MLRKHAQFTPDPVLVKNRKKHTFKLVDWWDSCMAGRRVMVGCCSVSRPDPPAAARPRAHGSYRAEGTQAANRGVRRAQPP